MDSDTLSGLEQAITSVIADGKKQQIGGIAITTETAEGKKYVRLEKVAEGFSLREQRFEVDEDNAQLLVIMLKKAEGIRDWMKEKTPTLQK